MIDAIVGSSVLLFGVWWENNFLPFTDTFSFIFFLLRIFGSAFCSNFVMFWFSLVIGFFFFVLSLGLVNGFSFDFGLIKKNKKERLNTAIVSSSHSLQKKRKKKEGRKEEGKKKKKKHETNSFLSCSNHTLHSRNSKNYEIPPHALPTSLKKKKLSER